MADEKFIIFDIDRKRVLDKLAIFDAKAALIDEKSLNRLNRELRDVQGWKGSILLLIHLYDGFPQRHIFQKINTTVYQAQKEYEAAGYEQAKYDA